MSDRNKILLLFGRRPEANKMAPLVHRLQAELEVFDARVCITAQHRQMLDQILRTFEIVSISDLDIIKPGQDLFGVTTRVLQGMKGVFSAGKPNAVLVHGDTTTTLATAMAGFYAGVAVGHVEAGLRTHNLFAPFPEEFCRQVASKATRWHFAPTEISRANLIAERVDGKNISVTGNTVIDALHWVLNRIEADDARSASLLRQMLNPVLPFDWQTGRFVLISGHHSENFGDGYLQICEALRDLASKFSDVRFVYPVHLNPNVQKPVRSILAGLSNVHLIESLDYEPFVYLLKHSHVVLTDSGDIQEEAPSLGKPVLVMRDVTERAEAVELVGAKRDRIVSGVTRLLEN